MLHPKGDDTAELKLLTELYQDSEGAWLLAGIGYARFDRVFRRDATAVETLGLLLQRSANNFFARSSLDPVLQAWREMPGSPVAKSGQRELWN